MFGLNNNDDDDDDLVDDSDDEDEGRRSVWLQSKFTISAKKLYHQNIS